MERYPKQPLSGTTDISGAALDDGTVKCWGSNNYGELGYGDKKGRGASPEDMGEN